MDSHELYEQLRNAMKEKYAPIYKAMEEEYPTYPEDDRFDMLLSVCRGGQNGLKDVRIENGKVILTYAGGEVDFEELKKEYAELKGYSDQNAAEEGLK